MKNYITSFKSAFETWIKTSTANTTGTSPTYFTLNGRKILNVYPYIKDAHNAVNMPLIEYEVTFSNNGNTAGSEDVSLKIDLIVWMAGLTNPANYNTLDNFVNEFSNSFKSANFRSYGFTATDISISVNPEDYFLAGAVGRRMTINISASNAII